MKKIKFRLVSMLLMLAVVVSCFASCDNNADKDEDIEPQKSRVTNVYKQTDIPLDAVFGEVNDNEENVYISNMNYANGVFYLTKNYYNYNTAESKISLCTVNESGELLSEMEITIDVEEIFADYEKSEDANYGGYINRITITPDDNILIQYGAWFNDNTGYEDKTYFIMLDSNGNELKRIEANKLLDNDSVYFGEILFDQNGYIYAMMSESLAVMDTDFNLLFTVAPEKGYIETIKIINGTLYVNIWDDTAASTSGENYSYNDYYKLYELDINAKKLVASEKVLPAAIEFYNVMTGPDYDIYYNDYSNGIYACNFGDTELTEICNYINSDISNSDIGSIYVLSKDKFITNGYDSETYRDKLTLLEHIPDEEVPEKIVITLGLVNSNYRLRNAAIKFNKNNDEYRITFKDYSKYAVGDDYDSCYTQLNNDIIAGKTPDIMLLDDNMPVNSYFKKGIFLDLNTMFESDPEINRSDFLENILDALEYDGKLYRITPSFRVRTVAGKKSVLGDRTSWTMAEMMQFVSEHSDVRAFYDLTRSTALEYFCSLMIDDFIDPVTNQCSFNSQEFMDILTFVKTLSEKSVWDELDWNGDTTDFWDDYDNMYRKGTTLLQITSIYNIRSTWNDLKYTFGEEATMIGFPTAEGNGSLINPDMELAISAKTAAKEGAWSFIKYLLSEEYAKNIYQLPINLAALDKEIEEAMEVYEDYGEYGIAVSATITTEAAEDAAEETLTDETTEADDEVSDEANADEDYDSVATDEVIVDEVYYYGDDPMTQEEIDTFMSFLKSLTKVMGSNDDVLEIIKEDSAAYFADQKSVEETVKIIQDRVMRVINE